MSWYRGLSDQRRQVTIDRAQVDLVFYAKSMSKLADDPEDCKRAHSYEGSVGLDAISVKVSSNVFPS